VTRKVKLVTPIRNTLRVYLENSWRCYLATIANYQICCEAVRSAILAIAWLLLFILHGVIDCASAVRKVIKRKKVSQHQTHIMALDDRRQSPINAKLI